MIDIYAPHDFFPTDATGRLLVDITECLLKWTDASELPIARNNSGAYLHLLPQQFVTAGGQPSLVVRVNVTIPEVVLSTIERRRGFVAHATALVTAHAPQGRQAQHVWITVVNAVDGGWGIDGHALTNAEIDEF